MVHANLDNNSSAESGEGANRSTEKACLVGGGIGSLAAAAFMIRDGGMRGENISIFEALPKMGGSLDGAGDPVTGYSLRGGRMLTTDNYECMWDLYKSIPSLSNLAQSVFDETGSFNQKHEANSMARHYSKSADWMRKLTDIFKSFDEETNKRRTNIVKTRRTNNAAHQTSL